MKKQLTIDHFDTGVLWSIINHTGGWKRIPIAIGGATEMLWFMSSKQATNFINEWARSQNTGIKNKHYGKKMFCKSGDRWTAIDNSAGDAFTEDFDTFIQCVSWLTLNLTPDEARAIKDVSR